MNLRPQTDEQFATAANALANSMLDGLVRLGMSPDETANLMGAALGTILANQLTPFGAVSRLRDLADTLERQLLDEADFLDIG